MRALCTGGSWHLAISVWLSQSGKNQRLVREGVQRSTVQHADYRSTKTRKSAQPGCCCCVTALQHSLTAPEVLHPHRLRQSERFEDSKMQRCRATWTRGSNASMQQNHATQPIQRRCSSTITTSRRAGRSQLSTTACASRRTSVVHMAPRRSGAEVK